MTDNPFNLFEKAIYGKDGERVGQRCKICEFWHALDSIEYHEDVGWICDKCWPEIEILLREEKKARGLKGGTDGI